MFFIFIVFGTFLVRKEKQPAAALRRRARAVVEELDDPSPANTSPMPSGMRLCAFLGVVVTVINFVGFFFFFFFVLSPLRSILCFQPRLEQLFSLRVLFLSLCKLFRRHRHRACSPTPFRKWRCRRRETLARDARKTSPVRYEIPLHLFEQV
jgi:hypothetical protein